MSDAFDEADADSAMDGDVDGDEDWDDEELDPDLADLELEEELDPDDPLLGPGGGWDEADLGDDEDLGDENIDGGYRSVDDYGREPREPDV